MTVSRTAPANAGAVLIPQGVARSRIAVRGVVCCSIPEPCAAVLPRSRPEPRTNPAFSQQASSCCRPTPRRLPTLRSRHAPAIPRSTASETLPHLPIELPLTLHRNVIAQCLPTKASFKEPWSPGRDRQWQEHADTSVTLQTSHPTAPPGTGTDTVSPCNIGKPAPPPCTRTPRSQVSTRRSLALGTKPDFIETLPLYD